MVHRFGHGAARYGVWLTSATFVTIGGCLLPDNYVANLVGSSLSQIISALLSDVLNTFFPPV